MKKKSRTVRTFGIMVANPRQRKYVLRKYLARKAAHMRLFCFTPSEIDWKRKTILGLHHSKWKWVQQRFPFPEVVYNRCYTTKKTTIERLEAAIGSSKCFNQQNRFDKYEIYKLLSQPLAPYLPETVPYDRETAAQLLETHKVLYVKPCYGYQGKGVYRVEAKESGEIHISQHYFSPQFVAADVPQYQTKLDKLLGSALYLVQQGVNLQQWNDQVFDVRALVQKDESGVWSVTNVVSRIAHKGCFNTSICDKICMSDEVLRHLYPHEKADAFLQTIRDISLKAAETVESGTGLHLGELSVDFALDNDERLWIIEVNGKPQKEIYDEFRGQDAVYKRPLQYADYLYTHSPLH
ncbi:YheC/YheD family protein [Paenibacillus elgii]|uniref:YheC/YheD family endospore coat-associated protein n=1 Tax=Paenibacillus elgii TaxID=189691 RepID=UPI000FDA028D|nr:YheC/YheD family protein [Paenibacillus elgii]NEN86069.1 YheC/YheD family protein [Paenibacillus elgii]